MPSPLPPNPRSIDDLPDSMLRPQLSYTQPALPAIVDFGLRFPYRASCQPCLLIWRPGAQRAFAFSPGLFKPPSDPITLGTQIPCGLNRARGRADQALRGLVRPVHNLPPSHSPRGCTIRLRHRLVGKKKLLSGNHLKLGWLAGSSYSVLPRPAAKLSAKQRSEKR